MIVIGIVINVYWKSVQPTYNEQFFESFSMC